MPSNDPCYIKTYETGELKKKIEKANAILNSCSLCPRECQVNRIKGEKGICNTGEKAVVCSFHSHFGEEAPLVGSNGSGTIFFTFCNLMCNFCQNYEISHEGEGQEVTAGQLAHMMMMLQDKGCHNINLVTPSHVVPQILTAVDIAIEKGLKIPIVYNTGAYDRVNTLKILDGVIDIYMPDFKFMDSHIAEATCKAEDYPDVAKKAVKEMHRQVGDLVMDKDGNAKRGLLVRHLVLPEDLSGTRAAMKFLVKEVSQNTYVNIMPQYRPCGRAHETKGLERAITDEEYESALLSAAKEGIRRFDQRRRVFKVGF